MVGVRGLLLCTARGFSQSGRIRLAPGVGSAAASSSAAFSSGHGGAEATNNNNTNSINTSASTADGTSSSPRAPPTVDIKSANSAIPPQKANGYARYVPQRFRRYTSGTAVGDYNMLRKAYARTLSSEYRHRPFAEKWGAILDALRPLQRVSTGNTVTPYYDTGDAYRAMWSSVEGAKESVKWQTYICKDDVVGKKTIGLIEDAHDRGLNVELLYDCGGNITGRTRLTQGLVHRQKQSEEEGSEEKGKAAAAADASTKKRANVIAFRPFMVNFFRYYRHGMRWQHSPALRNHRKILIVDEKEGYAGGLNIGDDYCATSCGGNGRFRDTHCKVTGPAVQHLMEVYADTINPSRPKDGAAPWRTITAASARRRLQYLNAKARQTTQNTLSLTKELTMGYSARTLQRMRAAASRRGAQLRHYDFRSFRHPFSALRNGDVWRGGAAGVGVGASGPPTRSELAKGSIRLMKARASSTARTVLATTANTACAVGHKAADAVEHTLERVVGAASERSDTLYAQPASDDAPIPEAEAFAKTPPITQILMCNPLTLDWSLPMAMWLVTNDAHRRVWVTTPYYLPHRKLTAAIVAAARRGVDVRIVAGSRNTTDPWFMWYASQFVTQRFLQAGVRVYEFEGGQIMHAKTVVVDSVWSSVGSYNWDVMSNKLMEVSVTTFGTAEAAEMEGHFRRDLAKSREISLEEFMNRSLFRRFQCAFFYYGMRFAEWMSFWNYYDKQIDTNQE